MIGSGVQTAEMEEKVDKLMQVVTKTAESVEMILASVASLQAGESLARLETNKMKRELELLKNEVRQRNIIIHDIREDERSESELIEIVLDLLNRGMDIDANEWSIDNISRVGKFNPTRCRPIRLGLVMIRLKKAVMARKGKLRSSKIYI